MSPDTEKMAVADWVFFSVNEREEKKEKKLNAHLTSDKVIYANCTK